MTLQPGVPAIRLPASSRFRSRPDRRKIALWSSSSRWCPDGRRRFSKADTAPPCHRSTEPRKAQGWGALLAARGGEDFFSRSARRISTFAWHSCDSKRVRLCVKRDQLVEFGSEKSVAAADRAHQRDEGQQEQQPVHPLHPPEVSRAGRVGHSAMEEQRFDHEQHRRE